ncbi:hypothetical protein LX15_002879 [Streptoalloteichus tenebrarius]|uniref:Trypsin-co-occurring domain-containing protein n=1 Tax=Streptoalloteichus tenebrarius (strain ATCC 17920 / DSM 40477 / JCM 4838 / CBS 697.72 / NBRC 16177 / NCIMB 11028 / NRRL B-12390 / A12253. 1 / ISP 5477) TaxID=1933 RepID=A0ABT1HUK7_STRSD|nr:CU044_2847 family protein [Streptoalloteichus tenebrarius]MCP2259178.1 hypothetical protein [Streptoalloteichus tenebrarius]
MTELVRFPLENGGVVTIEVDEEPRVARASRQGEVLREAKVYFERALGEVRNAAAAALGQFQRMARRPDEVEIKFSVKMDAKIGAVIANTGAQGQFEVKLKWQRPADDRRPVQEETNDGDGSPAPCGEPSTGGTDGQTST